MLLKFGLPLGKEGCNFNDNRTQSGPEHSNESKPKQTRVGPEYGFYCYNRASSVASLRARAEGHCRSEWRVRTIGCGCSLGVLYGDEQSPACQQ